MLQEREKRIEQDIRKAEEAAVHEEAQLRKEQEEREAAGKTSRLAKSVEASSVEATS